MTKPWIEIEKPSESSVPLFLKLNPAGYRINVNHHQIQPMYERYKKSIGTHFPLSDSQRVDFEKALLRTKFKTAYRMYQEQVPLLPTLEALLDMSEEEYLGRDEADE